VKEKGFFKGNSQQIHWLCSVAF